MIDSPEKSKLFYIPSVHTQQGLTLSSSIPEDFSDLLDNHWSRAQAFVQPALISSNTVRLYVESWHSSSGERVSFDKTNPKFPILAQRVEAVIIPGRLDQWDIILPFLHREPPTVVEFSENKEAYKRTKEILTQLLFMQGPGRTKFWEEHEAEFLDLQQQREKTMTNRINESLMPEEIGVLIFGLGHSMIGKLQKSINIESMLSEDERKMSKYLIGKLVSQSNLSSGKI